MTPPCAYCGSPVQQPIGAVNRAAKAGLAIYCDRVCSGLGRRKNKSREQKVAEKADYDREYRSKNLAKIKNNKRAYFKRTYDPVAAAEHRKTRMPAHTEYCRRPEYRKWKAGYDRQHRARKEFGDFSEAAILLNDLCSEIASRSTFYERAVAKGTVNKTLERKRDYARQTGQPIRR